MPDPSIYEQIVQGGNATRGVSYSLLERILGTEVMQTWVSPATATAGHTAGNTVAAYASPIEAALKISTTVAMLVLPLMGLYIVVTGLLKQERSGQPWNWKTMPLRMGLGAVFTAPVTPTGMSLVQALVVALALAGNSLGNLSADFMAEKIYSPGVSLTSNSVNNTGDGQSLKSSFTSITAKAVCWQSARAAGLDQVNKQGTWNGAQTGNEIENLCGAMNITTSTTSGSMHGVLTGTTVSTAGMDCTHTKYPATCEQLKQVNARYKGIIEGVLSGANLSACPGGTAGVISDQCLQNLANQYRVDVSAIFGSTQNQLKSDAKTAVNQMGWLGLGNFWQQLSKASAELDQYVYQTSEIKGLNIESMPQVADANRSVYDNASIAKDKAGIAWDNGDYLGVATNGAAMIGNGVSGTGTALTNGIGIAGNNLLRMSMFGMGSYGSNVDPMAVPAMDALNRLGILLGVTAGVFDEVANGIRGKDVSVASLVASTTGGVWGVLKEAIKGLANKSAVLLHVAALSCWMSAIFHTTILPMLPMLFSIIMGGEWLMWVVVALVAGPLWGVMHVMPSGDDGVLHPRTFHGWGLMGFIVLYPIVVVIGYGASIMVFNVLIPYSAYALTSYLPDGFINSSMYVVFAMPLVGFLMAMLSWLTLSLILQLPGMISGWIGIRPESWFTQQATQHLSATLPGANIAGGAGQALSGSENVTRANPSDVGGNGVGKGGRLAALFAKRP